MITPAEQLVVDFVHSGDKASTIEQRVARYRAFAATSNSTSVAAHFFCCADELAAVEEKIGQKTIEFAKEGVAN